DARTLIALDHGGAHHEEPVRPRHDIHRHAWMQQAHRAGKRHLPQAQEQHFSLHPAQVRKLPSCGEPGAIDYLPPGGTRRGGVDAVADGHSELPEPCGQPREGRARVEMSLIPEIQPLCEPSGQVRPQPRAALEDLHGDAALGELERAGEPCDPGPDDGDAHGFQRSRGAGAGTYSSLPPARNLAAISRMPCARASARTSCEMRMEQNFGPHMEQKCATLWPSFGSVASWKAQAVSGSSARLN